MRRKLPIIVFLVITLGAFGTLGAKFQFACADIAETVDSPYTIARINGVFSEPVRLGLVDILGVNLSDGEILATYSDDSIAPGEYFEVRAPVFNQEQVNREALEKLVEAYNSDPQNTSTTSVDDILDSLKRDFTSELLSCSESYSPNTQPFLFINWCMRSADVVYTQDVFGNAEYDEKQPFRAGDPVYQWHGEYEVDSVTADGKEKDLSTFRTFTNFEYVMYGDELFEADTAFRWEYEAGQGESV